MTKRKLYLGINGFVTFSIINILIANTFIAPSTASAAEHSQIGLGDVLH